MIPLLAALVWAGLVLTNWWAPFRFDPRDALRAWSLWGLPLTASDFLFAVRGHVQSACIALLVLLAIRGAGAPVIRLLRVRTAGVLGPVPVGIGAAGAGWLGAGLLGLVRPGASAWLMLFALIAAGGRIHRPRLFPPGLSRWAVAAAAGCALAALPAALAPEITYDAMAVHLGAPARWLAEGRIVRLEAMMFSDFPLAPQMAYLISLALGGGDAAAKWLHWAAGLGALGVAGWLGAALAGRAGANWTVAMLAGVPMIVTQMTRANADLWTVWATGAGVWWLLRPGSNRTAILAGLCLGAAAAGKLTAGLGIGAAIGVLSLTSSPSASSLLLLLISASLMLIPWLTKSLLLTGNPVYPFLWNSLGGLGWSAHAGAAWAQDMSEANSFNLQYPGWVARCASPWNFVMHDRNSGSGLAPFVPGLAPVLLLLRGARRFTPAGRRAVAVAAGWAVLYWLGWSLAARDPRFCLPAWPVLSALAAAGLLAVPAPAGPVLRTLAAGSVAAGLLFSAATTAGTFAPGPVVLGAVPRPAYLSRLIAPAGQYMPIQHVAREAAGPTGRMLVIGDVKAPAGRGRALYPSMYDANPVEDWVAGSRTVARLRVRLRQHGITAVFVHESGMTYLHERFGHFDAALRNSPVFTGWMRHGLVNVRVERVDGGPQALGAYRVIR